MAASEANSDFNRGKVKVPLDQCGGRREGLNERTWTDGARANQIWLMGCWGMYEPRSRTAQMPYSAADSTNMVEMEV